MFKILIGINLGNYFCEDKIIDQNEDKVIEYKNGKDKLFGYFVGQVMKESGGKANPKIVNQILKEKLN